MDELFLLWYFGSKNFYTPWKNLKKNSISPWKFGYFKSMSLKLLQLYPLEFLGPGNFLIFIKNPLEILGWNRISKFLLLSIYHEYFDPGGSLFCGSYKKRFLKNKCRGITLISNINGIIGKVPKGELPSRQFRGKLNNNLYGGKIFYSLKPKFFNMYNSLFAFLFW